MKRILETERLLLRNLELSDVDCIHDYRNNPDCARYQRWEIFSKEALRQWIPQFRDDAFLSTKEEQHYAVCDKQTGALVGELAYFYRENDCITLGITISYQQQKQGYAFEMLTEVIRQIRARYPALDIVALIEPENVKSIRLFERLGFVQECYAESIASCVYVLYGVNHH